ncbi:MAG: class I SAM-dependent rRNA methyltransferase [Myxococcota bacterium]
MTIPAIRLRSRHDRRVREGHPWVFANELDADVSGLPRGGAVDVLDAAGRFLGRGYANPASLITVRLLARAPVDVDDPAWWAERLSRAVERRARALPGRRSLRLVHAEGDDLPGLVIDRYGDVVVAQLGTLGLQVRKEAIGQAIREVLGPVAAVVRSEGPARQLEGLPDEVGPWFGDPPAEVEIEENGVRFVVPVLDGQKTGHFYDQADNRRFAGERCSGLDVLDLYANGGAWGLYALRGGARSVLAVDRSADCAERIAVNAERNGVSDRLEVARDDGKRALERLVAEGRRFGAVVLDPPAFAKARKAAGAALRGYEDVNALGLKLVAPGGWLFTSSCSWHVQEDRFVEAVAAASRKVGRAIRIVRRGEQAPDHPVLPAVPETRYLKSLAILVD